MKQKSLLTTLSLVLCLGAYTILNTSSSPGFSSYQGNCNCHGPANSATTVAINGLPTFYSPGISYPITVTVSHPTLPFAGFQIQANIGTLSTTDAGVSIQGGNMSAGHNSRKTMVSGTATFSMTWTAPTVGGTAANFTAVGNAVNGGGTGGDAWNSAPSSNIALPVNFLNVQAKQVQNHVEISFSAENEKDAIEFVVQRSTDATFFTDVQSIEPNPTQQYVVKDYQAINGSTYFYRVKEINKNNEALYSDIVSLRMNNNKSIKIYPTLLTNNSLNVVGLDNESKNVITIYDASGRILSSQVIETTMIDLPALSSGTYFVSIAENNQLIQSTKIIKQ